MNLDADVEELKGVGPKTAAALKKIGLHTLRDVLYYIPRTYEDFQSVVDIVDLTPGKLIVKGRIRNLKTRYVRRNFSITEGEIFDNTGAVRVVWFNQPYRANSYSADKEYYFAGNFEFKYRRFQLTSPTSTPANDPTLAMADSGFQPVYPAKGSFNSQWFKKFFEKFRTLAALTPDLLPMEGSPKFVFEGARAEAIYDIHFPPNAEIAKIARQYLAYEELFELILAARLNKNENSKLRAEPLSFQAAETRKIVDSLPFKLTNAQRVATWDILQDMQEDTPMNRLLQGDVGSGKTVVAAIAIYQAVTNKKQAVLLAPTAILATQHFEGLKKILEPLGVKVALLTAGTKYKTRLKKQIVNGEIDVVIGTHAILTDDTMFHSLALCIIDEQHRFGVMQRQKLLEKAPRNRSSKKPLAPHFLAMTATPIPRSLQLTIFGDLDISTINELPKGRQPIVTKIINEVNMKGTLYPEIQAHIDAGEQVYWICKLIEESKRGEASNVKKQTEKLRQIFPQARVEFLHGRMKGEEKDKIMADFAEHKIDILVSTTVVEVGVDVPNATQIVIMDAEGFGLAQLHQLRGRVGRGTKPSNCFLVKAGEEPASERLKEVEKSTDGFHLAEVDLKLRGPGEIYGQLQHGTLNLRIATLADSQLIHLAQQHANTFVNNSLDNIKNYPELARTIHKYQQLTTLN